MSKRINLVLPDRTLAVLDRVVPKGDRSRLVFAAVLHNVETKGKQRLRQQLKAGYLANADENLRIAAEWLPGEEEVWQKSRAGQGAKSPKSPISGEATSNDIGNRFSPLTIVEAVTSVVSPVPLSRRSRR